MNTVTAEQNVQAVDACSSAGALRPAWRLCSSLRAWGKRWMCRMPLWAVVATALSLAACKEAPPPRQFSTPDDYLTHPNPCVANTAKHIKASGRPWPNEEYPDPHNKGEVKIFDLWAGDRLYRIDSRRLNIFHYGGMKGEGNHPLQYRVMKETLVRLAGKEWVEERGLPLNADVFGTISCRFFENKEEEISWLNIDHPEGEPVERWVSSSANSKIKVGIKEWGVDETALDEKKSRIPFKSYSYGFKSSTTQEVYGQQVELLAWCGGDRLGQKYEVNGRRPRCFMKIWLGPGTVLNLQMEPPAPEHIGDVFNMIKKYLEESRVQPGRLE